jgi:hypothetical protein
MMKLLSKKISMLILCTAFISGFAGAQVTYSGVKPGSASISVNANLLVVQNNVLRLTMALSDKKVVLAGFDDKQRKAHLALTSVPIFELTLTNGTTISGSDFKFTEKPVISEITAGLGNSTYPDRLTGKKITANLWSSKLRLKVRWEVDLRNGDNFVTQTFTFRPDDSVEIASIILVKLPALAGAAQMGAVDGSPLVKGTMFFSVEHPMSKTANGKAYTTAYLPRLATLKSAEPLTVSAVYGVTPKGQLRRGFLYYTERVRAEPYRQVLHYNSWFDLSWADRKLDEAGCLDRIKVFTDSLINKRKVKLHAFLFDDGWDDNKSLWQFNRGFPNGFSKLTEAVKASNAGLGVWISPWGGYDEPKAQRLAFGKKQTPPFETNENGFSLTGPVYNKRFTAVATAFIQKYNVSIFKFDGVGAGNGAGGAGIAYQKDIEAFLKLINGLREEKPNLYLSLTVGTWPSVYWLQYGDAIWRAGDDTGLAGDGPKRQQWITYKDAQAYQNIVKRAPLFPLNSIMYHGICIAANGLPGKLEMDDKNIADEIWAFFGTGTGLQELYVDPHKLNASNWDCIRAAANWSKAHKQALADIHWVGGDPLKGQVYGYAGWADGKGVLTLRNPTGKAQIFTVKVKDVLNLPDAFTDNYTFFNAKATNASKVYAGRVFKVALGPYEVKVMDAKPF